MKKLLALCLALLMCLSLFACGEEPTTATNTPGTDASTENKGTESTEKPTETEKATEATEKGTEGSETEPVTPPTVEYDVAAAAEYLDTMYKGANQVTAADYQMFGQVMVAAVKYTVTWTVNSDKVVAVEGSPMWTIQVDEMSAEEVKYVLTGTVTAPDGTTATVSYDRVVPKFAVTSFEDYMAAEKGTSVTVAGYVVAINAKSVGNKYNHLFLADVNGKGGYYCYQLDNDPVEAGIQVGMLVSVTATVEPYSGMQEVKGGTFVILDKTINEVAPLDLTEKFAAGESLKNYVGMPVTIKGVTIGAQDMSKDTSQYLYFSLNGKEGYVRTYVTDFPTTFTLTVADGKTTCADKATIDEAHAANFGNTADATGILILYSGNPYLIPMSTDCFANYTVVTKTDAEKVDAEIAGAKFDKAFSSNTVVDLPAVGQYYSDVTLTWASDNGAIVIADGKATITVPDAETVVTITMTATLGEVTKTTTFEVKLSKALTSIKDAMAIGAAKEHNTYTEEKYLVGGIISEVYNGQYGNMYIVDEFGNKFTIYGTYSADGSIRYDAMTEKPKAGDYVVLFGALGQYNGTAQMKNAWIMSFTAPTTIPEAIEIGNTYEKNAYSENKYIVSGEITEIQNAVYGNVIIKDADGNSILVYGLYSADGKVRFDAMEKAPAVGDTITVLSVIGKYNDAQLKNAWLVALTPAATEPENPNPENPNPENPNPENPNPENPNPEDPTPSVPATDGVELTVDSLGLPSQSYNAEAKTVTVNGVTFEYIQLGNYGDGIQVRDKDGKTTSFWNTTAFSKPIAKIVLVYSDTKDVTYANPNCAIFTFGNAVGEATYTTKLSTIAGTKTYEIVPDAETYTFFKFEHDLGYTMYWKSITIVFAEGEVTPCEHTYEDVVTAPTCTTEGFTTHTCSKCGDSYKDTTVAAKGHTFADATCKAPKTCACGATEGDVVDHVFVEGKCKWCELAESHEHSYESNVTAPTCTTDGYTTKTCACGDVQTTDKVPATGHKDENNDYKCEVCSQVAAPAADSALTIEQAIALATAMGNSYTTEKYYITGRIVDISNTFYGNFNIVNAEGTKLYVYGLKNATGGGNFGSLDPQPAVGDEITIYTVVGCYQGTPQAKDAWLDELVQHTEHTYADATCKVAKTCTICGKVDGEPLDHTYVDGVCTGCGKNEPAQGTTVTKTESFAGLKKSGSYTTVTTTSGWTATNAAVLVGGATDANPVFKFIGSDDSTVAITLNGKTSAVGKLTSATLSDGISKLSFNYGHAFSDSKGVDITINIKKGDEVVATTRLDNDSVTQKTAYEFTWELDAVVEGEFVIEILNNSPSNSTSNKDRISIFNFTWESAPIAAN